MSRPRIGGDRRRRESISIPVNEQELRAIDAAAAKAGRTRADWARLTLLYEATRLNVEMLANALAPNGDSKEK